MRMRWGRGSFLIEMAGRTILEKMEGFYEGQVSMGNGGCAVCFMVESEDDKVLSEYVFDEGTFSMGRDGGEGYFWWDYNPK
jgi:hypothetical protein